MSSVIPPLPGPNLSIPGRVVITKHIGVGKSDIKEGAGCQWIQYPVQHSIGVHSLLSLLNSASVTAFSFSGR